LILRVHTAGGFLHRRDPATKKSYSSEVSDPRSSSTAPDEAPSASAPGVTEGQHFFFRFASLDFSWFLGCHYVPSRRLLVIVDAAAQHPQPSGAAFISYPGFSRPTPRGPAPWNPALALVISRSRLLLATPETLFACSRRRWQGPAAHCDRRSRRSRTFRCSSPRRERGSSRRPAPPDQ
jgi:hypothetical protein